MSTIVQTFSEMSIKITIYSSSVYGSTMDLNGNKFKEDLLQWLAKWSVCKEYKKMALFCQQNKCWDLLFNNFISDPDEGNEVHPQ